MNSKTDMHAFAEFKTRETEMQDEFPVKMHIHINISIVEQPNSRKRRLECNTYSFANAAELAALELLTSGLLGAQQEELSLQVHDSQVDILVAHLANLHELLVALGHVDDQRRPRAPGPHLRHGRRQGLHSRGEERRRRHGDARMGPGRDGAGHTRRGGAERSAGDIGDTRHGRGCETLAEEELAAMREGSGGKASAAGQPRTRAQALRLYEFLVACARRPTIRIRPRVRTPQSRFSPYPPRYARDTTRVSRPPHLSIVPT